MSTIQRTASYYQIIVRLINGRYQRELEDACNSFISHYGSEYRNKNHYEMKQYLTTTITEYLTHSYNPQKDLQIILTGTSDKKVLVLILDLELAEIIDTSYFYQC